jgi:hypothetical protein
MAPRQGVPDAGGGNPAMGGTATGQSGVRPRHDRLQPRLHRPADEGSGGAVCGRELCCVIRLMENVSIFILRKLGFNELPMRPIAFLFRKRPILIGILLIVALATAYWYIGYRKYVRYALDLAISIDEERIKEIADKDEKIADSLSIRTSFIRLSINGNTKNEIRAFLKHSEILEGYKLYFLGDDNYIPYGNYMIDIKNCTKKRCSIEHAKRLHDDFHNYETYCHSEIVGFDYKDYDGELLISRCKNDSGVVGTVVKLITNNKGLAFWLMPINTSGSKYLSGVMLLKHNYVNGYHYLYY